MPRTSLWVGSLGSAFLFASGVGAQYHKPNAPATAPAAKATPAPSTPAAAAMAEKEIQALLARLDELSGRLRDAQPATIWKFQIAQGDVLIQLALRAKAGERDNWLRMAVDCFHSAMVGSPAGNTTGQERLVQLADEISHSYPGCPVAVYAAMQEIEADYMRAINKQGSTPAATKAYRSLRLERFATANPKLAESEKLLAEAAQDFESLGKKDDAFRCFQLLAERYPSTTAGQKAASSVTRLRLLGHPVHLKLPLLYAAPDAQEREYDLCQAHGKLVVIYFWSSKCKELDQDFRSLKQLTDRHQDQGLEVVFVNLDEKPDRGRAVLSNQLTLGTHVHVGAGPASEVARHFGLPPIPQSVLVGKDGKLLKYALTTEQLEKELAPHLSAQTAAAK